MRPVLGVADVARMRRGGGRGWEEHHGGQNKLRIAGSVTQVDKIRSLSIIAGLHTNCTVSEQRDLSSNLSITTYT